MNRPSGLFIPNGTRILPTPSGARNVEEDPSPNSRRRARGHTKLALRSGSCGILVPSKSQQLSRPLRLANCLPTLPQPTVEACDFPMKKEDVYARMMHTPDDPERAELRAALREMRKHLLPVHRALIDAARDEYAANAASPPTPNQLLQLLQEAPFFAWLKPLTSLIVDIDSMTATDFDRAGVDAIAVRLERLFGAAADDEFSAKYVPILQRDVDVAIHHAGVRQGMPRILPRR
jgi:hypothetical protein